ncbi:hypothetical protein B0T14DRAFT_525548 [Immersiella caudata]|uniref:Uncharacterized protein n=1 Tax=Immersiella caudata TaxID=314043 RepID=A0AA40BXV4_9PEZI|nr:hypothetical protein B0T14DRAFT_525548 [Immersiella caudata]
MNGPTTNARSRPRSVAVTALAKAVNGPNAVSTRDISLQRQLELFAIHGGGGRLRRDVCCLSLLGPADWQCCDSAAPAPTSLEPGFDNCPHLSRPQNPKPPPSAPRSVKMPADSLLIGRFTSLGPRRMASGERDKPHIPMSTKEILVVFLGRRARPAMRQDGGSKINARRRRAVPILKFFGAHALLVDCGRTLGSRSGEIPCHLIPLSTLLCDLFC